MTKYERQEWSQRQRLRAQAPRMSHASLFIVFIAFMSGYYLGFHRTFNATMRTCYQYMVTNLVEKDKPVVHQLSPEEMLGRLRKERIKLERRLLEEYGEYYGDIFDPTVIMGKVFVFSEVSKLRLVRRFMMKFLSARMADPSGDETITFTWVTAGDSSAAGHGNLFDQSYTAVLEDTVKDAFHALGIQFIAKNYGMGGYVSAPELAMCMESVYGPDIDILMWDFSMMEQSAHHYAELWGNRAAVHRTKPVLFMFDGETSVRWNRFLRFELNGIGTFLMNKDGYEFQKRRIPDSNIADVEALPEALQYFICGDTTEGSVVCDDPVRLNICYAEHAKLCKEMKWRTKDVCHDARYQTSWHPGWKDHLLRGRLLGFLVLEILSDALIKYSNFLRNSVIKQADTETMLQNFYADEKLDYETFLKSPVDFTSWDIDTIKEEINVEMPFRNHVICHSALLPAHARYNGILMENGIIGDEMGKFETGINLYNVNEMEDGVLPLAYNPNDRQHCPSLEIDHKDFFYVKEGHGWLSVTVPNKSEINAYGRTKDDYEPEGIILMCLNICPMDRCSDDRIGFGKLSHTKKLFMTVDNKPVTDVKRLEGCHFLTGENGITWGPGQASLDGLQYEIKLRVEDPGTGHWLRVSSIIVF